MTNPPVVMHAVMRCNAVIFIDFMLGLQDALPRTATPVQTGPVG